MLELTVSLLLHALLGIALAALTWATGLGFRPARPVFAYPFGLLALLAAAFLVLVTPWLAPVSIAAVVLLLVRARREVADAAACVRGRVLWTLPGALSLPVAFGFLLHGPTGELSSHAYGDILFYAARLVSATQSVIPFRDRLVAGESSAYVESGSTFLGAALAWLPGFDPILFQTTAMPAFLLGCIPIGLGLLGRRGAAPEVVRWLPLTGLLAAGLVAYPTWATESPPVDLSLPLAFALYVIATERLPVWHLATVTVVCAADVVLTKGFVGVALVVVAVYAFARDHLDELDARRALALGGAAALVACGAAVLFFATSGWLTDVLHTKFLPRTAVQGLVDQLSRRDTQRAAPGFELIGSLLLVVALARVRAWPFVAVLAASLAGHWLVGGHGLDILVGTSILLAAIHFWREPDLLWGERWFVLASAAALGISAWFRDLPGVDAGIVFFALLAAALIGAFAERQALTAYAAAAAAVLAGLAGRAFVGVLLAVVLVTVAALAPRARWAVAAAALAVAAIVAAGRSELTLSRSAPVLTTGDYRVWHEVEQAVPPDGLVFTSLTGPVISSRQGWNYYPGLAGRQLYIAGWSNSPLTVDDAARAARLRANQAVLDGQQRPGGLPAARGYSSYYAVLRAGETPPRGFERLYANDDFALYRIPS